jgi:tetratricopeptide (TPR) repeat protein
MLRDEKWEESLQEYATKLLEEIRKKYPEKWNSSWKYDAFLGYAYDIILDYDERYAALKRAFDRVNPPPPQLLVYLARCCWAPGKPPITQEEAVELVKEAIKKTPYIEGISLLRGLYKCMGKTEEQKQCEKTLEESQETGIHLPYLDEIPEVE